MATGTRPSRSQDRYDRFAQGVDTPMLVITILWLPVLIISPHDSGSWSRRGSL
jgi:hypothetical protein